MTLTINAIILGIIQGLTEFLPISSTGHLIIAEKFLSIGEEGFKDAFFTIIQLGSILAVVLYFRKTLFPVSALVLPPARKKWFYLWMKIVAGVIPALLIGGLWGSKIQEKLYTIPVVAAALFVGGILLILLETWKRKPITDAAEKLLWWQILGIGLAQCVAMIPGVSRSAATIIGALCVGCDRPTAVQYSFFLAIPTMFAATGYHLLKHGASFSSTQVWLVLVGLVVAFASSWGVIAFLMEFIRKRDFRIFGYYRIALAILLAITMRN